MRQTGRMIQRQSRQKTDPSRTVTVLRSRSQMTKRALQATMMIEKQAQKATKTKIQTLKRANHLLERTTNQATMNSQQDPRGALLLAR